MTYFNNQIFMKVKDKKNKKEISEACEVCRINQFDNEIFEKIICKDCMRTVHKYCYSPDCKDKKLFKCDECKKKNSQKGTMKNEKTASCSFCGKNNGILKDVGNGQWMHILCALTCPRIRITAYKSLTFALTGSISHKKIVNTKKCNNCPHQKSEGLHCWVQQCDKFIHLDCIIAYNLGGNQSTQIYNNFLTIGLLNKNQNNLLHHLAKYWGNFKGFSLVSERKQQIKYWVCTEHNLQHFFVWCSCGIERESVEYVECSKCKRWYHTDCKQVEDKQKQQQMCKGCKNNDLFIKNVHLPQLFHRIIEIEGLNLLDKNAVKFLDHFCFKPSDGIQRLLLDKKNTFEIQRYYLRKALQSKSVKNQQNSDNEGSKEQNIEKGSILQIIYYLVKKQLKKENDITVEQLQQISNQLSNKNNKFGWSQQKGEKTQKKYKKYVQQKLKKMQKDDSRQIKLKLNQFIQKNKDHPSREFNIIAKQIYDIIHLMEKSQAFKQISHRNENIDVNNLIQVFYESKLSQKDIHNILQNISFILSAKRVDFINESDYYAIKKKNYENSTQQKNKIIKIIYDQLLKDIKIKRIYHQKQQIKAVLYQKYQGDTLIDERNQIMKKAIQKGIFIQSNFISSKAEINSIQLKIFKHKFVQKFSDPTPAQLEEIIQTINIILQSNKEVPTFKATEIKQLIQNKGKYCFYKNFIDYFKRSRNELFSNIQKYQVMEQQKSSPSQIDNNSESKRQIANPKLAQSLSQMVGTIIMEWGFTNEDQLDFAVNQLYELAQNKIEFQDKQKQIIIHFSDLIASHFNDLIIDEGIKLNGSKLRKISKIINYCNLQDSYSYLLEKNKKYQLWKSQLQTNYFNIQKVLQNKKNIAQLINTIDKNIDTAQQLQLDVEVQLRKLKILKMWALLSQKLHSQSKSTLNAIVNIKNIMNNIRYPLNQLRRQVQLQESESKNLNKRINKFLQKIKPAELQIYEELKLINAKMSIEEANELKRDLQLSNLDVQIQLHQIIDQIKEFKNLPKNIYDLSKRAEYSQELLTIRKKILQSPFRYHNIDDYDYLLRKINELKCYQFRQGVHHSKKQFFRLLNTGGAAAADLLGRFFNLHKAYKDVELAERQINNNAKPKYQHLLSLDGKKIKIQFKDDVHERTKIEKWYQSCEKLRDKYRGLKQNRSQFDKFLILENQLSKIPINNRDILQQISKMKKDIQELTNKIKTFIGNDLMSIETCHLQSPFYTDIVFRYSSIGARTDYLDKFQFIYTTNKKIMEISRNLVIFNYATFSLLCRSTVQITKNQQIYRVRQQAFFKIWKIYIDSSDPLMQIGCTLLTQGGALCTRPSKAEIIVPMMVDVNNKFNKWNKNLVKKDNDEQQQGQEQQEEQQEQSQQEDDEQLQQMEDDDQNQLDESDEESSSYPPQKRSAVKQIVDLDDD